LDAFFLFELIRQRAHFVFLKLFDGRISHFKVHLDRFLNTDTHLELAERGGVYF